MKKIALFILWGIVAISAHAEPIEVGFSPGNAEQLVIKGIDSASKSIFVAAYSFTSTSVVRALISAKNRGVNVYVVADYETNAKDQSGAARSALNNLVNAGIDTRTISAYAMQHSKYMVIDGLHVETGSFNFSKAAASKNSENVVMMWNEPLVAVSFQANFRSLYELGQKYQLPY